MKITASALNLALSLGLVPPGGTPNVILRTGNQRNPGGDREDKTWWNGSAGDDADDSFENEATIAFNEEEATSTGLPNSRWI